MIYKIVWSMISRVVQYLKGLNFLLLYVTFDIQHNFDNSCTVFRSAKILVSNVKNPIDIRRLFIILHGIIVHYLNPIAPTFSQLET
jgi:hypothetical protein